MQVLRAFFRPALSSTHNFSTVRPMSGGLAEFFESGRDPNSEKKIVYGRSWRASELRLKSWDDLHKLWYVFLKEKNMLLSQKQMLLSQNLRMPNPERMSKVRKSMCRLKQVLTERAMEVEHKQKRKSLKRMINSLLQVGHALAKFKLQYQSSKSKEEAQFMSKSEDWIKDGGLQQ